MGVLVFSRILNALCGLGTSQEKQVLHGHSPDVTQVNTKTKSSPIITVISKDSLIDEPSKLETSLLQPVPEPQTQRAFAVVSRGTYGIIDLPFPTLDRDDEIIISTRAVGLNPIDWKSVDYNFCLPSFPWVTGREMAGVVEQVGPAVKGFKVGDRVWTSTYYRDRRAGCFQEYVAVPYHTVTHIPSNITFETAACLGVPALTAAMTIWKWLQVPIISAAEGSAGYILIWGGSTITGQFAIQIARKCGLKVIAVASGKTKALVESLGAVVVVRDNKSGDEIVAEVRNLAGNAITRAIDVVGHETAAFCLKALSTTEPCLFAPLAFVAPEAVVQDHISVLTVEMKQFVLDPTSRVYAVELDKLIAEGAIRFPEIEVLEGGLEKLEEGLEIQKKGDRAGRKVVVKIA